MSKHMAAFASKGKARDHFYRRDPARARRGMRGMTYEEKGLYNEIIDITYEFGRAPVDDPKIMSNATEASSVKQYKRVRDSLIAKGRIRIVDGRLVDEASISELEARAAERAKSKRNPDGIDLKPGSSGIQSEFDGLVSNENNALKTTSKKVESESEVRIEDSSSSTDLTRAHDEPPDADLDDEGDEGIDAGQISVTLPSRAPEDLHPNVVLPIGQITDRDPKALHQVLIAISGPRLVVADALRNSISIIATALLHGCDPNDMATVVVDRTHGQGKPIPTWRYFLDAWYEARDRRVASAERGRVAA